RLLPAHGMLHSGRSGHPLRGAARHVCQHGDALGPGIDAPAGGIRATGRCDALKHSRRRPMRTFTRRDGTRQLFCTVELSDGILAVTEGEIGAEGGRRARASPTAEQAQEEHDNLIATRRAEGYREESAEPAPPAPLQEALEAAIVANPDDLSAHM